jgi:hypothetical protein
MTLKIEIRKSAIDGYQDRNIGIIEASLLIENMTSLHQIYDKKCNIYQVIQLFIAKSLRSVQAKLSCPAFGELASLRHNCTSS